MLTERDIPVLTALARYYLMTRHMIQNFCYLTDRDGRLTRRRLSALCRDHYISKHTLQVVNPRDGAPSPVYHLAKRGCQFLAEHLADDRYLCKPTSVSRPNHLQHYLAITRTHMLLDEAIAESNVELMSWFHEDEVINPEELDAKKHFKLFAELRKQPRLCCIPDAGFLLSSDGHRLVCYLEQDRDRDNYSHKRVAALKSPGYAELHRRGMHRRHFPTTTLNRFLVVMIAPTEKRRNALRRAFTEKDGATLWRFASQTDLSPTSFLHGPVWYRTDWDEPEAIVQLQPAPRPEEEPIPCNA